VPANAQNVRFHDAAGGVTGSARTDTNGVTTFHDRGQPFGPRTNRPHSPNRRTRLNAVVRPYPRCWLGVRRPVLRRVKP
jgi:hypothetical protein